MREPIAAAIKSFFAVCTLMTTDALAADIVTETRVDRVMVYRQGATISRAASVDMPAGDHRLIVRGLPDGLDPGKLRVASRSSAVRLAGVELERKVEDKLVNESERRVNRRVRDLQDQRTAAQDEIAAAETQLKLLDSAAKLQAAEQEQSARVSNSGLTAVLNTLGQAGNDVRARIRQATFKTRDIDEQIAAAKEELSKIATGNKATTELHVNVRAASPVAMPLTIEYHVSDAGWIWLYESRLDSEARQVSLTRHAAVRQGTGEDWSNVELTVSSSKPSDNAATPPISPLFVSLVDRQSFASGPNLEEIIVTAQRRSRSETKDESEVDETPIVTSEVFTTEFTADFRIPGRVGVPADRQTRIYPISEDKIAVNLVARAILSAERVARLEATFNYESDVLLDAGDMQLYRDGAFIGVARLPAVLPGVEVRMPFGVDERIRIVSHEEREESGKKGLLGKHRYDEHKRRFEITSHHAEAIPIEVIERLPVPQHEDVVVDVLEGSSPPSVKDLNGKQGVYLWRLEGTPRKTQIIRHYYSIRFPKDKSIASREGV